MSTRRANDLPLADMILATGQGAPSVDEKIAMIRMMRDQSPDHARALDAFMVREIESLRGGMLEAREHQAKMKDLLDKLTSPPMFPATFLRRMGTSYGDYALVLTGNTRRVVGFANEADANELRVGDDVLLSNELNAIVARPGTPMPDSGELATFERFSEDGRLVVRSRDEEYVVCPAADLDCAELAPGDLVRWDPMARLAFERLEGHEGKQFFINEIPDIDRSQVGGQDAALEALLSALTATLVDAALASTYGLSGRQCVLLSGPPGCGKTLMARVAAAETSRLSGQKCRFAVVKPAEWYSPYVGVTEMNIRRTFQALREASECGPAILFLDEIETIGRTRGGSFDHHSDRFLGCVLAEIEGFAGLRNVSILAACNRKDLCDPALLERISAVDIYVPRPDMRGARAIFAIHLPESLPFNPNGSAAAETRGEMIECAVSAFYSPNADNELCVVTFRDGKTRTVYSRELASGRIFEQICTAAKRYAFLRHVRGGEAGLRVSDILKAVSDAVERLASTLTRHNIHGYLEDLPQDVDIVSVEPVKRKVQRTHEYLRVA